MDGTQQHVGSGEEHDPRLPRPLHPGSRFWCFSTSHLLPAASSALNKCLWMETRRSALELLIPRDHPCCLVLAGMSFCFGD